MVILNQRFQYFTIDLCQNYSNINDSDCSDSYDFEKYRHMLLTPKEKNPKRTKYYYTNDARGERIILKSCFPKPIETQKEKQLKRHYGNPFAQVETHFKERSVKIIDNKISFRIFSHSKYRGINNKFFRKNSNLKIIKIDLNTGDFTLCDINSTLKRKHFRKNNFETLKNFITEHDFFTKKYHLSNESLMKEQNISLNDDMFIDVLLKKISSNLESKEVSNMDIYNAFIDFFVMKKKIKTPNNYHYLISELYPTEKFLKKNDRKLILSVLDSFGMKSKFFIKYFHENSDKSIVVHSFFVKFFGDDYPKYMTALSPMYYHQSKIENFKGSVPTVKDRKIKFITFLEKKEKENLVKIINSFINCQDFLKHESTPLRTLCLLIDDHIEMYKKIKDYEIDVKINATNKESFMLEHQEFTRLSSLIKKGWTIEYQYDNRMVRYVESPITVNYENKEYTFFPIILKREEEYETEGDFMHHCVASYSSKENSLIVSLRTNNGMDRVTCEFNKKTGECVQSRHFCNANPPKHFERALDILDSRVKRFKNQRLLNHVDVKKVRVCINGIEIKNNTVNNEVLHYLPF